MGETKRKLQQRIQEREKELQELRKAVETLKVTTEKYLVDKSFSCQILLFKSMMIY